MADKLSLVLTTDEVMDGVDASESLAVTAHEIAKTVLVGRMVSIRGYGLNFIKPLLPKAWGCKGKLKVLQKGFNTFLFIFTDEEDLHYVLQNAPWTVANCHLVVNPWPPHLTWEQWQTWVQFKYESLAELYWFCGKIGHLVPKCWLKGEDEKFPEYDIPEKGYGPWIKANTPVERMYVRPKPQTPVVEPPPAEKVTVGTTVQTQWGPQVNIEGWH
ncbi:hypothetical protein Tsubulata_029771 [Turnera subulata]|uniref:DUF4283 domain-containing protein n=1 Tax=Turnera subulata TaxID=218843 RepID=A0A9Q0EZJ3_9ROSI|nr:hypothetical protein Tsubulata_029771 [Turnera subulata]